MEHPGDLDIADIGVFPLDGVEGLLALDALADVGRHGRLLAFYIRPGQGGFETRPYERIRSAACLTALMMFR